MSEALLDIVYSDEQIVVVNKPGGLLTIPGKGPDKTDCVTSRLKTLFPKSIEQSSVHRLDQPTSGLLVLALNQDAHSNLSIQFQKREVKKEYIAVVEGVVEGDSGRIELPFRLDVDNRPYQIYDPVQGKMGITVWEKIEVSNNTTRVRFKPLTGRTHQLRLHAAHKQGLGCPIVGDSLYGSGQQGDLLKLCAVKLSFKHPFRDEIVTFEAIEKF